MNILMIFRNNPFEASGAVAFDLFNDFKSRGHQVKLMVNNYGPNYPEDVINMESAYKHWNKKIKNKLKKIFGLYKKEHTENKYHFHEINERKHYYQTKKILRKSGMKPDAIVILFAKNFINSKNIYELHKETGKPIYWLMYDTSPLTGGCHYSWDCTGYQKNCGSCPGLYSSNPKDKTYYNLQYKKAYMDKTDISIIIASEWQYRQVVKSAVFKNHPIHKILISINPEIFKPVNNEDLRRKLSIPENKKVIFFGAKNFIDERKGFKYVLESLAILKEMLKDEPEISEKIFLLIAGQDTRDIHDQLLFDYRNLGMLDNHHGIASAYQAADLFLCPSIEDAGPSMVNQSLMCGTPVLSFAQGVSLDLVTSGETGYCAKLKDSYDLAKGLYNILTLSDEALAEMKGKCRSLAMEKLHPEVAVNNWMDILQRS